MGVTIFIFSWKIINSFFLGCKWKLLNIHFNIDVCVVRECSLISLFNLVMNLAQYNFPLNHPTFNTIYSYGAVSID